MATEITIQDNCYRLNQEIAKLLQLPKQEDVTILEYAGTLAQTEQALLQALVCLHKMAKQKVTH